ncbi:hypothetical protein CDCA_CDCA01G0008 [Cyanidium caldarium]|uniref:Uncharacterized protein n=1 Tax=Cyanidium caldarium TaxID=2771 RepID=A0AAV9IP22_CYACA|nr:hypothetical protein CDCA_CDCA01G0008 [Cyanidium caldarium]
MAAAAASPIARPEGDAAWSPWCRCHRGGANDSAGGAACPLCPMQVSAVTSPSDYRLSLDASHNNNAAEAWACVQALQRQLAEAQHRVRELEHDKESLQLALSRCIEFDRSLLPPGSATPFRSYRCWETPCEKRIFHRIVEDAEQSMATPQPFEVLVPGELASPWLGKEQVEFERSAGEGWG